MISFKPSLLVTSLLLCLSTVNAQTDLPEPSDETAECLLCHEMATPGIVADWRNSRHAMITPGQALEGEELARRISVDSAPEGLGDKTVGCFECHGLRTDAHADTFEHFGYDINLVVSPADCATCHPVEQEQFSESKKAHAVGNLRNNPVYHGLETEVIGMKTIDENGITSMEPTAHTQGESCYACHGTVIEMKGLKTVDTDFGEMEVPDLANWPNQGVGRINPDGSKGACTACHTRHAFSISVARKAYTCSQCHLEPDLPAYNVWKESKHGNLVLSDSSHYDWSAVPWTVGEDFRAPSCSACHNALVTDPFGEVVAERTHDFGSRLWLRIFGLTISHPQPVNGDTTKLRNADGLPLPVTLDGELAAEGLIDADTMAERQALMSGICKKCHSTDWVNGHFTQFDAAVAEADEMVLKTTGLMSKAWNMGYADPANLFDEPIEHMWVNQWLINANTIRYASAMNGQDYAAFKYGWWGLSQTMAKMHAEIKAAENKSGESN